MTSLVRLRCCCALVALLSMPATLCRAQEPVTVAAAPSIREIEDDVSSPMPIALPPITAPSNDSPPIGSETDAAIEQLKRRLAEVEDQLDDRQAVATPQAVEVSKKFTTRPFGRLHIDTAFFDQDAANKAQVGNARNGSDIRRARLGVEGEGFEMFFYRFDVDFVTFDQQTQTRPTIFDAYLDTLNLPVIGNLRVGHFREPFSLERLTSSHDLSFMERSVPVNTLAPFRNLGIMPFDWNEDETATWSYGVFNENSNEFGEDLSDRAGISGTGRVTWLPYYDEAAQGRYLLHLGASYTYRKLNDQQRRFAQTPEVILKEGATRTPNFIDTGVIPLNHYQVAGAEASMVWGSLCLQTEYLALFGDPVGGGGLFLHGGYFEASYFLTGENRNYLRPLGIYGPVTPYTNFFRLRDGDGRICTGRGMWEATARFSWFDANDRNVNGGQLNDVTLGLNWYYAVRCRVMFNYIHAFLDRNNLDGNADVAAFRFQYAF